MYNLGIKFRFIHRTRALDLCRLVYGWSRIINLLSLRFLNFFKKKLYVETDKYSRNGMNMITRLLVEHATIIFIWNYDFWLKHIGVWLTFIFHSNSGLQEHAISLDRLKKVQTWRFFYNIFIIFL